MTARTPSLESALVSNDLRLSAVVLRLLVDPPRLLELAGITARAVVLGLIARGDPALGAALRRPAAARPYTVALLPGERTPSTLAVRVTAVGAAIPQALAAGVDAQAAMSPLAVGCGQVVAVRIDTDPTATAWAGTASLSSVRRQADLMGDTLTLELASPVLPRQRPAPWRDGPPLDAVLTPALLFEAMRERWLALGTAIPCPEREATRRAAEAVEVVRRLVAVQAHLRRGGLRGQRELLSGFAGLVTVRLGGGAAERTLLRTLAAMSFYLGAGAGTSVGMGCVRALSGGSRSPLAARAAAR